MSFDLYFRSKTKNFTKEMFENYFSQRDNYALEGQEAIYENLSTGVYFYFAFNDEYEDQEGENYHVNFNMNYFRPHFFALEAVKEVTAFLDSFDFEIEDPQIGGMGNEYSEDGFLDSWNKSNESSYGSILPQVDLNAYHFAPSDLLVMVWAYNYYLPLLQERVSKLSSAHVPTVQFGMIHGKLQKYIFWPNLTPIAIHTTLVDVIVFCKSSLDAEDPNVEWGFYPVNYEDFKPFLEKYATLAEDIKFYLFDEISEEINKFYDSQKPSSDEDFVPLNHDVVLDLEIAENYLNFE